MGGKPWQSTGCFNCKQRKKKCDKQEPGCQRCLERGVQCQGYAMNRIFFHQKGLTKSDKPDKEKKKITSLQQADTVEYLSRAKPIVLNDGPSRREQIVSSYIAAYFPTDVKGSIDIDPWYKLLAGISKLPSKPMMLDEALSAKAFIWFSKMNQKDEPGTSKDMYHYGLQLYNSAIEHMSHQLNRKRKVYSDALIYTIALFQILVTCHCPQGLEVWLDQITVTNGILRQYYNRASDSPLVKSLYLAFHRLRLMQSLSPIQSKGPNDVAAPNDGFSYTIPPEAYQPIDELFEIMAAMSPLLNALDTINISSHETRQKLLFDALAHRNLLMAWYTKEVEAIGGLPWVGTPVSKLPPAEHFFGPSYCFSSLDCARIHVLYWAALSILQGIIGQAWCYTYFPSPSPLNIFNDNEYQQSKFYADEISRAIPYCLSESHRAWGSNITIFSLGQVAKVYLEFQCREEFAWAQEGFKLMGSMGSDFPNRVSELLEYNWRVRESASASPSSSQSSPPTDQETSPGYLIDDTQ